MNFKFPNASASKEEEQNFFDAALEIREEKRLVREDLYKSYGNAKDRAALQNNYDSDANLGSPEDPVAFERINLENGEFYYVGKQSFTDSQSDPVVLAWKAPLIMKLRQATPKEPGQVQSFRRFSTSRTQTNHIDSFEDEHLADLLQQVEHLQESDKESYFIEYDKILQSALNEDREEHMRDIVRTIMASQATLISKPADSVLIVQGGPGTGKTSVALHRVSWMLHNYSKHQEPAPPFVLLPEDIAVVGPNPTFTRYIDRVLPQLGDDGVRQEHFLSFISESKPKGHDTPTAQAVKSSPQMGHILERALFQRVRIPKEPINFKINAVIGSISLDPNSLTRIVKGCATLPYLQGRNSFRKALEQAILEQIRIRNKELPRPQRGDLRELIDKTEFENLLNRIWPTFSARDFLRDFYSSLDRILEASGNDIDIPAAQSLRRARAERITLEPWSPADIVLLDHIDHLMGNAPDRLYKHIVVDEAQDLSPMLLSAIARRSESGNMTLVGDIAQATHEAGIKEWNDLAEHLEIPYDTLEIETLKHGYRVPKSAMEVAAALLPHIAPTLAAPIVVRDRVQKPEFVSVDPRDDFAEEVIRLQQKFSTLGKFVGIISSDRKRSEIETELNKREVNFTNADNGFLGGSVNILSPASSKGLEFDSIIVADPLGISQESTHGLRSLYISLTRTTGDLEVIFDEGELIPELVEVAAKFGYDGTEVKNLAEAAVMNLDLDYETIVSESAAGPKLEVENVEPLASDTVTAKPVNPKNAFPQTGASSASAHSILDLEILDNMLDDLKPHESQLIHSLVDDVELLIDENMQPKNKELAIKYLIARLQLLTDI